MYMQYSKKKKISKLRLLWNTFKNIITFGKFNRDKKIHNDLVNDLIDNYIYKGSNKEIEEGIDGVPIIRNENNEVFINTEYITKLLDEIASGETRLYSPKIQWPMIIGLWKENIDQNPTYIRYDTEKDYALFRFHNMESYIDDEWDENEKELVCCYLLYFKDHGSVTNNIYITDLDGNIYTDGKFCWHETLLDFIKEYNVKPPLFFIEHIQNTIRSIDHKNWKDFVVNYDKYKCEESSQRS